MDSSGKKKSIDSPWVLKDAATIENAVGSSKRTLVTARGAIVAPLAAILIGAGYPIMLLLQLSANSCFGVTKLQTVGTDIGTGVGTAVGSFFAIGIFFLVVVAVEMLEGFVEPFLIPLDCSFVLVWDRDFGGTAAVLVWLMGSIF